jgi:hypothetical protein
MRHRVKAWYFIQKKLTKKYEVKKKQFFMKTQLDFFLLKFHFEIMVLSVGFVLS